MGGDEEDGALAAVFVAGIVGRLMIQPILPSQSLTRLGPSLSPPKGGKGRGEGGRSPAGDGVALWCLPRPDLYGPGLAAHGLDPGHVVLVRAPRDAEILWAMEEGLRTSGVAAVVGEVGALPAMASRRLQLAAERSGITAFLLRRWRDGGQAARERALPNAATTRWRIAALPSRPLRNEPGVGHPRWRVELLRCRGFSHLNTIIVRRALFEQLGGLNRKPVKASIHFGALAFPNLIGTSVNKPTETTELS